MQKTLGFLVVISIVLSITVASLMNIDIVSGEGLGWVLGYGLGSVLLALLLCSIPLGIYWVIKRTVMPKFIYAVCITWALIFVLATFGNFLAKGTGTF